MTTETYTTIAGEVIEFPTPGPALAQFLSTFSRAAHDPSVSEAQLVELMYGKGNPLLDQSIFPGRGAVTKAVLADPVYHVMLDLLDAKRTQVGTLSKDAHAVFEMTVGDAALKLGVTPSAVRQAIAAGHLAATKRGNVYFLDPRSVDAYRKEHVRRGPVSSPSDPALRLRIGNKPGSSFRVKAPDVREVSREGNVVDVVVPRFARAAIAFSAGGRQRMFVLESDEDAEDRFEVDGFFVEGRYRVVEKINNARDSSELFKAFVPLANVSDIEVAIGEELAQARSAEKHLSPADGRESKAHAEKVVRGLEALRERVSKQKRAAR